jgi:hypothetical protein
MGSESRSVSRKAYAAGRRRREGRREQQVARPETGKGEVTFPIRCWSNRKENDEEEGQELPGRLPGQSDWSCGGDAGGQPPSLGLQLVTLADQTGKPGNSLKEAIFTKSHADRRKTTPEATYLFRPLARNTKDVDTNTVEIDALD